MLVDTVACIMCIYASKFIQTKFVIELVTSLLFRRRYMAVPQRYYCSKGAMWLFRNSVDVPNALNGCPSKIVLFHRRYIPVP